MVGKKSIKINKKKLKNNLVGKLMKAIVYTKYGSPG